MAMNITRGWGDQPIIVNRAFAKNPILERLVTRNSTLIGLRDCSDGYVIDYIYIIAVGRFLREGPRMPPPTQVLVAVVGEMMAPELPDTMNVDALQSLEIIRAAINRYARTPLAINTDAQSDAFFVHHREQEQAAGRIFAADIPIGVGVNLREIPDDLLMPYLRFAARTLPTTSRISALKLVVNTYIAIAKRGTVSDAFCSKINEGIQQEIGISITPDAEGIKNIYSSYGRYITEINAQVLFKAWEDMLPATAMRVRLTLQQTALAGLTSFVTVGRAMKAYPTFPWSRIYIVLANDCHNYMAALTAVNGNRYYGFKQDLGVVKSTNFKSLTWVAKELLIKIKGEGGLKQYQGWTRQPEHKGILQALIDDYVTQHETTLNMAEVSVAAIQSTNALLTECSSDQNADIFTL